ncbi:MAG: pilin [Candidatus Altiarchaeota archaeon]
MDWTRKSSSAIILINLIVSTAAATAPLPWVGNLRGVAYALGWMMMVLMGVKWIVADSPNERADAKKSMIYVVIGLLVVASACGLLQIYCDNAAATITCPINPNPPPARIPCFTCNPATYC